VAQVSGESEAAYRLATKALDPINFVPDAAPAALLFQFSNNDKYISKEIASSYSRRREHTGNRFFGTTRLHDLNVEAARKDRRDWLARQLALTRYRKQELRRESIVAPAKSRRVFPAASTFKS